jgi:Flp pilus assembly pilin Flp
MPSIIFVLPRLSRLGQDTLGQELVEYALMAGFLAVTVAAIIPGVATGINTLFSQVGSALAAAATQATNSGTFTSS